jgi:hypothetical protein
MLKRAPRSPTDRERRRAAARERQRRCRAMRRDGKATYRVAVDGSVLDMLISLRYLTDHDATNPRCVAHAISRALADAARSQK